MLVRSKESSSLGFRHISRPLAKGESLPRLPSLIEQVMACHFEPSPVDTEEATDVDAWDDEDEESGLDAELVAP